MAVVRGGAEAGLDESKQAGGRPRHPSLIFRPHEFWLEDSQILGLGDIWWYSVVSGGILVVCRVLVVFWWYSGGISVVFVHQFSSIRVLSGLYSATDSELLGWYFATTPGGIRPPYSGGILEVHPPLILIRIRFSRNADGPVKN